MRLNIPSEGLGLIFVFVGVIIFIWSFFIPASRITELGQVGDFNGGVVSSIWALAGVVLFYVALKSQQAALKDQKESTKANIEAVKAQTESLKVQIQEFELQRRELEQTRKVFIEQSETLELQRFENTFFSLLKLKSDLFNTVYDGKGESRVFGMRALERIWPEFINSCNRGLRKDIDWCLSNFQDNYQRHINSLDPYFITLFHILNILDQTQVANKIDYINLFVSQLSELEKLFLFYKGARDVPGNHLKPLLERFSVLRFIDQEKLIDASHINAYNWLAFNPDYK